MTTDHVTLEELCEHYASTDMAARGVSFDQAMQIETCRRALYGAVKARRKLAARQAKAAPINYQIRDEEAA